MADQGETINLKILSPSTEVEGGINLPDLPAATTVKELRQKIQDAAPSKPATERMRLIYRGRVVANDNDRLVDIFGSDSIRESKDQSLHLVLRELPSTVPASAPPTAPPSSTASPNPFRPSSRPPQSPLQTNPFRALPQTRPASQPQVPQPHHHHHPHAHHHHHPINPFGAGPPVALPPHLQQQLMQNQLAQALAQNAGLQAQQTQPLQTPPNPEAGGANAAPANVESHVHHASPASPNPNHAPNTTTRVIRHQGIGPNGERWMVTWNNTNVTLPINPNPTATQQPNTPRQFFHPPSFAVPFQRTPSPSASSADQSITRIRWALHHARQRMNRLTPYTRPSAEIPPSELDEASDAIRSAMDQIRLVEEGLLARRDATTLAQSPNLNALHHFAREARNEAADMERTLNRLRRTGSGESVAAENAPSTTPAASATPTVSAQTQSQSDFPPQLFILSSPQGPVGLLFDQRGTYTTAPMMPALPFQTFNQQFAANRQLIAGIGQQIAQNSLRLPNAQGTAQPPLPQQPAGAQSTEQHQNQVQNQEPNQAQAQAMNQNQPAPAAQPPEQDRVGVIAGHLWLVFKLACFVYFFAGGGSWYRPLMLGCVAGLVYLAQIGLFDTQFNMVRRHFEALLPLADRAVQPPNARNANPPNRRAEPDQNLTPENAAQRLVQQRHDQRFGWIRETMRSTERAFAIFVASLWPGIGERMVQAQEERERAERAAEEERQRQREEEATRQEEEKKRAEESAADLQSASSVEDEASSSEARLSASAKGKERAVESEIAS